MCFKFSQYAPCISKFFLYKSVEILNLNLLTPNRHIFGQKCDNKTTIRNVWFKYISGCYKLHSALDALCVDAEAFRFHAQHPLFNLLVEITGENVSSLATSINPRIITQARSRTCQRRLIQHSLRQYQYPSVRNRYKTVQHYRTVQRPIHRIRSEFQ